MKDVSEVTALVCDYGKFIFLAECLAETCAKVYYHSPINKEFLDIRDCVKADGIPSFERIDEFLDPEFLSEIDLAVFPDIGFGDTQRYLRSIGKAVWGAMGVNDLELSRTKFIRFLDEMGLDKVENVTIRGVTNLSNHLKEVSGKWVKINRFRKDMETWHHLDWAHSVQKLDELAVKFGGVKEHIVFVVQDEIESDVEIGYDGWTVDGNFPPKSFQGYELKNELYLGSLLDYEKLPWQIREINKAMSPLLSKFGYRNFLATEIRVKDNVPYFIDPTFRMAGLTEDQLPVTCSNLADVIWQGANGNLIEPQFVCDYVSVATMHFTSHQKDHWFQLHIPEEAKQWAKLYHYCQLDGMHHFIPSVPLECDEAGVVIGIGNTIEESIESLKQNFALLKAEPLRIEETGFADLLKQVKKAESEGMEFSDQPIPQPEIVLK